MDTILKIATYSALGLLLASANVWYVKSLFRTLQPPAMPELIQPFQVIGKPDDGGKLGVALAHLLQGSLGRIRGEALRSLDEVSRSVSPVNQSIITQGGITIPTRPQDPIQVPHEVFSPLAITMNVAGVEVGS